MATTIACAPGKGESTGDDSSGSTDSTDSGTTLTPTTGDSEGGEVPCTGRDCPAVPCTDEQKTTLSGIVFAPEGTVPLYNVTVYVPGGPLEPIPEGVTCGTCDTALPGDPVVATRTDAKGAFVLEGVPAGTDIPLVISIGKWRREVIIPEVVECTDNLVPHDLTRLPRNQSEGHIPKIAVVLGDHDSLECVLRKIGLDDSECTLADGPGRVNLFGTEDPEFPNEEPWTLKDGAVLPDAGVLWNSLDDYKKYDLVFMNCEGTQVPATKSAQARQNLVDYADLGGRVFLSHFQNIWIAGGPDPWPSTATFNIQTEFDDPTTALIDTNFPKGQVLADWMVHVAGSMNPGEIEFLDAQHTIDAVNPETSTRWAFTELPTTSVQYYTFNTPVGVPPAQQCGRVVDSDTHVAIGGGDTSFPAFCSGTGLTSQEKAFMFMLFDLSNCLIPDADPV